MNTKLDDYEKAVAGAIIAVDTIWGGDVNCRSGTGRVIADSYFSGKDLPDCYHGPLAESLRASGGVSSKTPDKAAIQRYLDEWKPSAMLAQVEQHAQTFEPLRKSLVLSLVESARVQLDLAFEQMGGPAVSYERCVTSSTGTQAKAADPAPSCERVRKLLADVGVRVGPGSAGLLEAVDGWRKSTWVGHEGIEPASARLINQLDALVRKNFVPHLPAELQNVPRANVKLVPIQEAWFSGSMNYLGRERNPDGTPHYEAEYEINAKIEKSQAEFEHLVAHEVVPGHVTTFAFVQHLHFLGRLGFEATVLTMNTRHSTLFEGMANAGLLLAYGVQDPNDLPTPALRLGVELAKLEDIAKNNASYFTWADGLPPDEIKRRLRQECLSTEERANKLTDAWAKHPLMGRAYMPSYYVGTELVLELLKAHGPAKIIPVMYGAKGLCDCVTVRQML